ncbi:N-acetylmuramoyl-L-alanine amidase family protein [Alkaliphilus serpentinus]|uniref:N-acetylmuramoyl-L-alanine amidase n=1 Tax=Alkaliphilus serpentinus TaxID=1482731 RepID=A0A833M8Q8_9FIRM|nr:N-acetylmuramoyl-L-alanine amidase [Alkaliphilus serpentinus]KAB3531486.1 N-acetylmuramoyl-L-alanine amidase [Alkaliphilus serpentinus]
MKIVIDPGHGGEDRANIGPTGYVEADGVLDIGLRLKEKLIKEGYEVLMTREDDKTVSLSSRTDMANEWQGELYLSLHTNAASTPKANGIETFHSYNGEWGDVFRQEAKNYATVLQGKLIKKTGRNDRGIKTRIINDPASPNYGKDYYYVIRTSKMPAVIVEMGFHTNPEEEALLKTEEYRETLADGIFESVKEVYPLINENVTCERKNIHVVIHGKEEVI